MCAYNGITGKIIKDGGISVFNIVTGPISAVDNSIAVYNLTSGKIIKDGGILSSNIFKVDGSIAMSGVINQSNTTDASSLTTGSFVTLGGIAVAKKAFIGDDVVIGPSQTMTLQNKLTLRGTVTNIAGPHYSAYVSTDQYPIYQQLNWSHDNISHNYDAYFDGTNWRSSQ